MIKKPKTATAQIERFKNIIVKAPSDWTESHLDVLFRPYDKRVTIAKSDEEVMQHLDAGGRTLVINCEAYANEGERENVDLCIGFNWDTTQPDLEIINSLKKKIDRLGERVAVYRLYTNSLTAKAKEKPFKQMLFAINKKSYLLNGEINKDAPYAPLICSIIIKQIYIDLLEKVSPDEKYFLLK